MMSFILGMTAETSLIRNKFEFRLNLIEMDVYGCIQPVQSADHAGNLCSHVCRMIRPHQISQVISIIPHRVQ